MMLHARHLLAGPGGNGCGTALLSVDGGATLVISVVPKMWPTGGALAVRVDASPPSGTKVLHVIVRELEQFTILAESISVLQSCVVALTGLTFTDDRPDQPQKESSLAHLFEETFGPSTLSDTAIRSPGDESDQSNLADAFWAGVDDVGASSLVRTPFNHSTDEPSLLGRQMDTLPSLERVLRELFVTEAEIALRRRMPDFRTIVDEVSFVRGALTTRGLHRIARGEVSGIECSFAELDHDHPWQQVVRAAARCVARRDLEDQVRDIRLGRCRRIERTLRHVSEVRGSEVLRERFDSRSLGKNRHASVAARLGVAILRRDSPMGNVSGRRKSLAVATGLRISTARLFEIMLTTRVGDSGSPRLVENPNRLSLLRGQPPTKRPDLLLLRAGDTAAIASARAIVDAKYKLRAPEVPSAMDMADQYQQFAYAATTDKPTVFIFATPPETPVRLSSWHEVNVRGLSCQVAVATIPFPSPGLPWKSQLRSSLEALFSRMGLTA
jgi:hypothetical protein